MAHSLQATDATQAKWYAVRTKPRQESRAVAHLNNQGYQVYLPHTWQNRRRQGKWQRSKEVLFPGYLFIYVDPAQQSIAPIRSTQGVIDLVRIGSQLVAIDAGIIRHIQHSESLQANEPTSPARQLTTGDPVFIVSGPLAGITAAFQMAQSDQRVMVLVNLLGGLKSLSVEMDQLSLT